MKYFLLLLLLKFCLCNNSNDYGDEYDDSREHLTTTTTAKIETTTQKNLATTTTGSILFPPAALPTPLPQMISPPAVLPPMPYPPIGQQPCQSYCNSYPQFCGSGCGGVVAPTSPPITTVVTVPIWSTRIVQKNNTRIVPKEVRVEPLPVQYSHETICPLNFRPVKDVQPITHCVRVDDVQCPPNYVKQNDRCVLEQFRCPSNFIMQGEICVENIICPHGYQLINGECIAPQPHCPLGYHWNGKVCQIEQIICQQGSILIANNRCRYETVECPYNFKRFGNQCIEDDPTCPSTDYTMDYKTKVCTRTGRSCPSGSIEYNGQCVVTKHTCPVGSKLVGDMCTIVELINTSENYIQYVNRTMTMPGPPSTCQSYGQCQQPCLSSNSYCNNQFG